MDSLDMCPVFMESVVYGPACIAFLSSPLIPSFPSLCWVYEAILPKQGLHFKQLLYISKSTKYFYYYYSGTILLLDLLGSRSSMHLLSKFKLKILPYPKLPSSSVTFLHYYDLVTEQSFLQNRIKG